MSTDVRGRVSVDVQFWDRTAVGGANSIKTLALQGADEVTGGKVAIVTGTVGTAAIAISRTSLPYLNSAGQTVSMTSWTRVAIKSDRQVGVYWSASFPAVNGPMSRDNQIALAPVPRTYTASNVITIVGENLTGSYTLVVYGT